MPHHKFSEPHLLQNILDGATRLHQLASHSRVLPSSSQRTPRPLRVQLHLPPPSPLTQQLQAIGLSHSLARCISEAYVKSVERLTHESEPVFVRTVAALQHSSTSLEVAEDLVHRLQCAHIARFRRTVQNWAFQVMSTSQQWICRSGATPLVPLYKRVAHGYIEDPSNEGLDVESLISKQSSSVSSVGEIRTIPVWPAASRPDRMVSSGQALAIERKCISSQAETSSRVNSSAVISIDRDSSREPGYASQDLFSKETPPHAFPTQFPLSAKLASKSVAPINSNHLPNLPRARSGGCNHKRSEEPSSLVGLFNSMFIQEPSSQSDTGSVSLNPTHGESHSRYRVPHPACLPSRKTAPLSPVTSFAVVPCASSRQDTFSRFADLSFGKAGAYFTHKSTPQGRRGTNRLGSCSSRRTPSLQRPMDNELSSSSDLKSSQRSAADTTSPHPTTSPSSTCEGMESISAVTSPNMSESLATQPQMSSKPSLALSIPLPPTVPNPRRRKVAGLPRRGGSIAPVTQRHDSSPTSSSGYHPPNLSSHLELRGHVSRTPSLTSLSSCSDSPSLSIDELDSPPSTPPQVHLSWSPQIFNSWSRDDSVRFARDTANKPLLNITSTGADPRGSPCIGAKEEQHGFSFNFSIT